MQDNEIVMQITVRRCKSPPYFDFDIDKYPSDDKQMISLMVLVKMGLEKTIQDFTDKAGFTKNEVN